MKMLGWFVFIEGSFEAVGPFTSPDTYRAYLKKNGFESEVEDTRIWSKDGSKAYVLEQKSPEPRETNG